MRRFKLVLGVAVVMVAALLAFAAPVMADDWNDRHDNNTRNHDWSDNNNRHNDWFDHRDNNDDVIFLISDNDFDDFDDNFDGFYPYWGWGYNPYWGGGGGCEGPVCLID